MRSKIEIHYSTVLCLTIFESLNHLIRCYQEILANIHSFFYILVSEAILFETTKGVIFPLNGLTPLFTSQFHTPLIFINMQFSLPQRKCACHCVWCISGVFTVGVILLLFSLNSRKKLCVCLFADKKVCVSLCQCVLCVSSVYIWCFSSSIPENLVCLCFCRWESVCVTVYDVYLYL